MAADNRLRRRPRAAPASYKIRDRPRPARSCVRRGECLAPNRRPPSAEAWQKRKPVRRARPPTRSAEERGVPYSKEPRKQARAESSAHVAAPNWTAFPARADALAKTMATRRRPVRSCSQHGCPPRRHRCSINTGAGQIVHVSCEEGCSTDVARGSATVQQVTKPECAVPAPMLTGRSRGLLTAMQWARRR